MRQPSLPWVWRQYKTYKKTQIFCLTPEGLKLRRKDINVNKNKSKTISSLNKQPCFSSSLSALFSLTDRHGIEVIKMKTPEMSDQSSKQTGEM